MTVIVMLYVVHTEIDHRGSMFCSIAHDDDVLGAYPELRIL